MGGELKQTLSRTVGRVHLGPIGVNGSRGTLYFDDPSILRAGFESRRYSTIGLLPDPGVADPNPGAPGQGWLAANYAYDGTQPHAVTSVTRATGTDTYVYDQNGNMTCRVEAGMIYKQYYNAENRIASIARVEGNCQTFTVLESWSFGYDGDGVRTTTAHDVGGNIAVTRYYFGGAYETHSDGTTLKYYSFAGQTLAMRAWDVALGTWNLTYFLTDHLGSTLAVLDDQGNILQQQRYLPFGEPRELPNRRAYRLHLHVPEKFARDRPDGLQGALLLK